MAGSWTATGHFNANHMKGKIKMLVALLCAGALFVIALDAFSGWKTRVAGAFVRRYPPHLLTAGRSINLGVNSYYFAGASDSGLVLGNLTNPRVALQVSWQVLDTATQLLEFPAQEAPSLAARLWVQGHNVVVTDGQAGTIFNGDWKDRQLAAKAHLGQFSFTQACVLSPSKIAIRRYDVKAAQNALSLFDLDSNRLQAKAGLLTKQVDGVFCVEGKMQADHDLPFVVYTYLFRNQYLVTDTNLNLRYRGRTIDTNSMAKIKVAVEHGGSHTELAAPPVVVNQLCAVGGNHLLVASMVLADNDPDAVLKENAIIDVYDLSAGSYEKSFYLSKEGHQRLTDLCVYNGVLYALIDAYLYSYKIN